MIILLSADIGGTKTIIELSQYTEGKLHSIKKEKLNSASYNCFANMLAGFVEPEETIDAACFAIAGPIRHEKNYQTANVTNLPWEMENTSLQKTFGIAKINFINDFQAMGYAIEYLSPDDFEVLQQGRSKAHGVRAIIGAGTGLGEAILVFNGRKYEVLATEGGHQDFAPNSALEIELYQYIHKEFEHVSFERVLSGSGLISIFRFLIQHETASNEAMNQKILNSADPAAEISQAANSKSYIIAEQALALFMKIYGAKAGNLALACLPTAGIYITGGIAGKNLSSLKNSEFIRSFNAKGRMKNLMKDIPVNVVTNQEAGLMGATQYALGMINNE